MTPKQYQRELREILSNLANYTYNAGVAAKNYGIMISGEPTKDALQAILDLNERALPDWTPHKYSSEYHKQVKSIIGKGK